MANKTQKTDASVADFLDAVEPPARREDAKRVCALMEELSGSPPAMWGTSIVGFGSYSYRYASGREGDWMEVGFSPRKSNLVLYIMPGFSQYEGLLERLGKHKTGKSCLYITRLANVDMDVLRELIRASLTELRSKR